VDVDKRDRYISSRHKFLQSVKKLKRTEIRNQDKI
jgi:hypothetical protein